MGEFLQRNKKECGSLFCSIIILIAGIVLLAVYTHMNNNATPILSSSTICPNLNYPTLDFSVRLNYVSWLNKITLKEFGIYFEEQCPSFHQDLNLFTSDGTIITSTDTSYVQLTKYDFNILDCHSKILYKLKADSIFNTFSASITIKDSLDQKVGYIKGDMGFASEQYKIYDSFNDELLYTFDKGIGSEYYVHIKSANHTLAQSSLVLPISKKIIDLHKGTCSELIQSLLTAGIVLTVIGAIAFLICLFLMVRALRKYNYSQQNNENAV